MIIYLDMDGVCCDFFSAAIEVNGYDPVEVLANWPKGEYDICKVLGHDQDLFWTRIEQAGSNFWATLKVYPWFRDLYAAMQKLGDVVFLTSPSWDAHSLTGKKLWLENRLGKSFRDFVITNRKSLLSREGTILIDDSQSQVTDFAAGLGGYGILFPQPWNAAQEPEDRMAYVVDAIERVGLQRAWRTMEVRCLSSQ